MISLPVNKQWKQTKSDLIGSLAGSFGLNLTETMGKTKVSSRMIVTTTPDTFSQEFGTPVAFRYYINGSSSQIFALCGKHIFRSSGGSTSLSSTLTLDTGLGAGATTFSADYSDIEIFNSKIVVSGDDDSLIYGDGTGWTTSGSHGDKVTPPLVANKNHKLLNHFTYKRLYVFADLRKIYSLDTSFSPSTSGVYTMNLATATASSDMFLISMVQTPGKVWILTGNQFNNDGYVYLWDGKTADVLDNYYPIGSRAALAGIVKDGTPYIIDADGRLQYFNGGQFVMAPNGQLPVKQNIYLTNPISLKNDRWIHPNGISIDNGRINILINNLNHDANNTIEEFLSSGIWEYVDNGQDSYWYHKYPLSQYDYSAITPTITDYGQNRLSRVGALFNVKKDDRSSSTIVGTFIAGADYYTDASTSKSASFINDSLDTLQKYGYFVTAKIVASRFKENWPKLGMHLKRLLSGTDKIIVKYRSREIPAVEISVTWTSSTTFTCSTASIANYSNDDEVEGIQGGGSGRCAHIINKVDNSGTSTITLDETLGASSGTAKVRFQHWIKLGTFNDQSADLAEFPAAPASGFIQLKVCMLFTGANEIYDTILDNTVNQ